MEVHGAVRPHAGCFSAGLRGIEVENYVHSRDATLEYFN